MRVFQFCIIFIFILQYSRSLKLRIYEGQIVPFGSQKHLVLLRSVIKVYGQPRSSLCSGSIIDKSWIISAAHCFVRPLKDIEVYHMTRDANIKLIAIIKYENIFDKGYVAEEKTTQNEENDLALLKTNYPIVFNENTQPIKLASIPIFSGWKGIIAGYGQSETKGLEPKEGVVYVADCENTMRTNLLCSVEAVRAGSGDSGGPLIMDGRLRGVVTQSCTNVQVNRNCATIYVDILVNLDWIQDVMESCDMIYD